MKLVKAALLGQQVVQAISHSRESVYVQTKKCSLLTFHLICSIFRIGKICHNFGKSEKKTANHQAAIDLIYSEIFTKLLFGLFNVHTNPSGSYWDNHVFDISLTLLGDDLLSTSPRSNL